MFAVYACAHFEVTPKASYLHAVKRIFRHLKVKPHLGLWYPKDSPFDLVAYSDSDYAGACLDRKSATGGVNIPRCDKDRLELMELVIFLLPSDEKVRVETSVAVKKVNDIMRLQALVDKKKVIITESTIRDALYLDDAEGIECLPNEEIFIELARMGYEKPSTKLTFYKAFFSRHWKFLIHTILKQVGDLSTHTTKYTSPALTQKVFANMRWVGKGFSGVETPLFEGMIVEQQVDEGGAKVNVDDVPVVGVVAEGVVSAANDEVPTAVEEPAIPSPTPPTPPPQPLQDQPLTSQGRMIVDMDADVDVVLKDDKEIDLEHANKVLSMQVNEGEPVELQEVVEVVITTKLITEVVTAASATLTVATPQLPIDAAPTLTTALNAARRRKGVVIRDFQETTPTSSTIIHSEANSKDKGKWILVEEPKPLKKQAQIEQDEKYARELEVKMNKNIDWDEVIDHVQRKHKEDKAVKRYQDLKKKPQTEAQARKNMMIYLRNVAGFKMDYFKGMTYDDIHSRALKRINESQEDKAAKKQKLDEEVEELKRHLQIVPNDKDDVYTEATPLARKWPCLDLVKPSSGNGIPIVELLGKGKQWDWILTVEVLKEAQMEN
nr:uncharacterized mitochondrial protein AtMg00810-like [Tanacetum cinerariifolium]